MSVKIYNAYKLNHEWFDLVQRLKEPKKAITNKALTLHLNRKATCISQNLEPFNKMYDFLDILEDIPNILNKKQ